MSNLKVSRKPVLQNSGKRKEWPVVIIIWTVSLLFLGYVIGRMALDTYQHPYHWASGLLGGLVGLGVGWIWYKKRGDIL